GDVANAMALGQRGGAARSAVGDQQALRHRFVGADPAAHHRPGHVACADQPEDGILLAHGAAERTVLAPGRGRQDWLKKPRSISIALSSAVTVTLAGVSRNTRSATRCIEPSRAEVRPLEKSISRLARSDSAVCRLTITGTSDLRLSATFCASLNDRGTTRTTCGAGRGGWAWTLLAAPGT